MFDRDVGHQLVRFGFAQARLGDDVVPEFREQLSPDGARRVGGAGTALPCRVLGCNRTA